MKTQLFAITVCITSVLFFVSPVFSSEASKNIRHKMPLNSRLKDAMFNLYRDTEKPIALLESGADPNAYNGNLFDWALVFGSEPLVRSFIRSGAKITPKSLGMALSGERNSRLMTEILLNRGANPNATIRDNRYDREISGSQSSGVLTPLMFALQQGHSEAAMLLVSRDANVHTRLKNGSTALKIAANK